MCDRDDEQKQTLLDALGVLADWLEYEREVGYFTDYDDLVGAISALSRVVANRV